MQNADGDSIKKWFRKGFDDCPVYTIHGIRSKTDA